MRKTMTTLVLAGVLACAASGAASAADLVDFNTAGFGVRVAVSAPANVEVETRVEALTILCRLGFGGIPEVGPRVCPVPVTPAPEAGTDG